MSVKIIDVEPHSKAARHAVKSGDTLESVNGHAIEDVLDYRFYLNDRRIELILTTAQGKKRRVVLHKDEAQDIGLVFETYLMDAQHSCKNKCMFCFVDQMPEGMRKSLYFKDDDSRLSFLFGNYITLTGLSPREAQRIIDMHISPVNVSVHTMNPVLRVKMMKNPHAGECLDYLRRFAEAGISLNTQLVLCPGINDGAELEYSLSELSKLYPSVQSIAAVPVGLTKHRDGLCELHGYTKEEAASVLATVNSFGESFLKEHDTRLAFAADEFFLKAEQPIPDMSYYEDFPQLDNGVGTWALLADEFEAALSETDFELTAERTVSVATGVAAYPLIKALCDKACAHFSKLKINAYEIHNCFFGESVTVAGLVTGSDLLTSLSDKPLGEKLLIPAVMLRHEKDMFLDDVTLEQAQSKLKVSVQPVDNDGNALLNALLGIEE